MDLKHRSKAVVEGDERACHRAYLRDLGLSDEEIARPFIGVINSRAKFHPGHAIPRTFSEEIKKGALLAGGTPFECNTWRGRGGDPCGLKGNRVTAQHRCHDSKREQVVVLVWDTSHLRLPMEDRLYWWRMEISSQSISLREGLSSKPLKRN